VIGETGGELGRHIAIVLRVGTLAAVVALAAGYVIVAAGGASAPAGSSVLERLGDGPGDALLVIGLLALTLTPLVAVLGATIDLVRAGERTRAMTAALVVVLLLVALVAAASLTGQAS
jgi:hypothetical protein